MLYRETNYTSPYIAYVPKLQAILVYQRVSTKYRMVTTNENNYWVYIYIYIFIWIYWMDGLYFTNLEK